VVAGFECFDVVTDAANSNGAIVRDSLLRKGTVDKPRQHFNFSCSEGAVVPLGLTSTRLATCPYDNFCDLKDSQDDVI
jgi:hypothetical protein